MVINLTATALQKYWKSEGSSFISAVDLKYLGLTTNAQYESKDFSFSVYIWIQYKT